MKENIQAGTVFIRQNVIIPETLKFASEFYSTGWTLVQGLDGYALNHKIHETGWHFFYLAGGSRITVFGRESQKTVGNAIRQIMARLASDKNNAFEITGIKFKTFLGVSYANVAFHIRNIQESMWLGKQGTAVENTK